MIVALNRTEILVAIATGRLRHENAKAQGVYTPHSETPEGDIEKDGIGMMGEIAFGKAMDHYVHFTDEQKRYDYDFLIRGNRIDVKTYSTPGRDLMLEEWKIEKHGFRGVDSFVLIEILDVQSVMINDPSQDNPHQVFCPPGGKLLNIVGFIEREEAFKVGRMDATGKRRIIPRGEFKPIAML